MSSIPSIINKSSGFNSSPLKFVYVLGILAAFYLTNPFVLAKALFLIVSSTSLVLPKSAFKLPRMLLTSLLNGASYIFLAKTSLTLLGISFFNVFAEIGSN